MTAEKENKNVEKLNEVEEKNKNEKDKKDKKDAPKDEELVIIFLHCTLLLSFLQKLIVLIDCMCIFSLRKTSSSKMS